MKTKNNMEKIFVITTTSDNDGDHTVDTLVCPNREQADKWFNKLIKVELDESWPSYKDHTIEKDENRWYCSANYDDYWIEIQIEEKEFAPEI